MKVNHFISPPSFEASTSRAGDATIASLQYSIILASRLSRQVAGEDLETI